MRLSFQSVSLLFVPVREDLVRLDLVLVASMGEEDPVGHRESDVREFAETCISSGTAAQFPRVLHNDIYRHLHLLQGDAAGVFTGPQDVAAFDVKRFERVEFLIYAYEEHRVQLCSGIHHGDGFWSTRGQFHVS